MSVYLRQELVPILHEISLLTLRDRCLSVLSKAASAGISPRRDSLVSVVHSLLVEPEDILELLKHISLLSGNSSRIDRRSCLSRLRGDLSRVLHGLCLDLSRNNRGSGLLLLWLGRRSVGFHFLILFVVRTVLILRNLVLPLKHHHHLISLHVHKSRIPGLLGQSLDIVLLKVDSKEVEDTFMAILENLSQLIDESEQVEL